MIINVKATPYKILHARFWFLINGNCKITDNFFVSVQKLEAPAGEEGASSRSLQNHIVRLVSLIIKTAYQCSIGDR